MALNPDAKLTKKGEAQLQNLGKWILQTYHGTLWAYDSNADDEYAPDTIRIESTDFQRAIISSYALASGLFPNANEHHNHEPRTRIYP